MLLHIPDTFQSTLPRRERPGYTGYSLPNSFISIHTPTKGATLSICEQLYETRISIHTPTKGATMVFATYSEDGGISIHTPTKGATVKKFTQLFSCIFQSTLPRRERQRLRHRLPVRLCISIHTPTKGATRSDILRKCAGVEISIHTPTKGATRLLKKPHIRCVYFNPHSHEGSDLYLHSISLLQ